MFSRPEHKLAGQSYVGRILVLDAAKGGVATAWMLHEMAARGIMPAALVLNRINPIMVQGAALADFTMMSGFDADITRRCRTARWWRSIRTPPSCASLPTHEWPDIARQGRARPC